VPHLFVAKITIYLKVHSRYVSEVTGRSIFFYWYLVVTLVFCSCCIGTPSDSVSEVINPSFNQTPAPTFPPVSTPSIAAPSQNGTVRSEGQSIQSTGGTGGIATITATYAFPFAYLGTVTVTVPVNASVYWEARRADKYVTVSSTTPSDEWIPAFYLSFINAKSQEDLYGNILREFRKVKEEHDLDQDQYLELLTVFVQSMPYQTEHSAPKFPVETLVENGGDCDDKSLLLAALLAREGYNVTLFYFDEEKHTAVGVADADFPYLSTGYAYIETTSSSYIGIAPVGLEGGRRIRSIPMVIRVGDGTQAYTGGNQTKAIGDAFTCSKGVLVSCLSPASDSGGINATITIDGTEYRLPPGTEQMNQDCAESLLIYQAIAAGSHDRSGTYLWLSDHHLLS
jgi:hypothetical protein